MIETLSPVVSENSERMLCFYTNITNKIQIARITNIANYYFERVVFPGERLLFEGLPNAELEIYTTLNSNEVLLEVSSCASKQVD